MLVVVLPALAVLLAALAMVVVVRPAGAQQAPALQPQVPDITQDVPKQISVIPQQLGGRRHYRLAFRSAAENRFPGRTGGGAVVLVGRRPNLGTKTMTVDQHIDLFDPHTGRIDTQEVHRNVGTMRFVTAADHQHWHLVGFERYELRRASSHRLVTRDRKTGFCVGNRYEFKAGSRLASRASAAVSPQLTFRDFSQECGKSQPTILSVTVGLSPGWGDDYKPLVEGQFIDITEVPSGRYVLVHRVNPSRKIRESDYTNNASSVLLDIRRRTGSKPTVRTLAKCLGTDRCPAPATP